MRFKGTAVLFAVFAALAGWVYWTDVRGREGRERREAAARRILDVDADAIVELRLTYPGRSIAARRAGAGWEFIEPPGLEADPAAWDTAAANIGRIDRDDTVAADAADLAVYGLDPPAVRVSVHLEGGTVEEIHFGNANPRGAFRYAKLSSNPEVFLAASSWASLFEKSTTDLRDRTVLRFDPDSVESIEVRGANPLRIVRDPEGWRLSAPIDARADDGQVDALLSAMQFARARDFADDAELEAPAWEIELNAGERAHVLLLARPAQELQGAIHARDASREPVFVVDPEIARILAEPLLAWRDRRIAIFDRAAVGGLAISSADDSITLRRSDENWRTTNSVPVDGTRVSAMLDALEFEEAVDIVDVPAATAAFGLDNPRLRVVLTDAGGAALVQGAFGAEAGGADRVYWRSGGDAAVKVVSRGVFDRFDVTEAELGPAQGP